MDPEQFTRSFLEALGPLLRTETITALTAAPIALQWAKKLLPWFTGQWAALLSPVIAVALILPQTWGVCAWSCVLFQCIAGWIYIEVLYVQVVEKMADSSNPLVPKA